MFARGVGLGLVATLVAFLAVGAAVAGTASRVRLVVSPATVHAGGSIRVVGNAGTCHLGDTVFVISRAFPGRQFGVAGALSGRLQSGGVFAISGHVRTRIAPGRYAITGRCGGGNLGVVVYLRVR